MGGKVGMEVQEGHPTCHFAPCLEVVTRFSPRSRREHCSRVEPRDIRDIRDTLETANNSLGYLPQSLVLTILSLHHSLGTTPCPLNIPFCSQARSPPM